MSRDPFPNEPEIGDRAERTPRSRRATTAIATALAILQSVESGDARQKTRNQTTPSVPTT